MSIFVGYMVSKDKVAGLRTEMPPPEIHVYKVNLDGTKGAFLRKERPPTIHFRRRRNGHKG